MTATTPEEGAFEAIFAKYDPAKSSLKPGASIPFYVIQQQHEEFVAELRAAILATPHHQERGAGNASYNIEAIAKVISLSYGENPDDDAPPTKICGPNNEPLPNWQAYEEQAKAVFVWFDAVLSALHHQERGEVVKLEWVEADETSWLGHGTDMCQYYIRFDTETASYWLPGERPLSDDDDSAEEFLALDDAKAAAQADFERRILSALVPSSLLREAQEALQKTRDALVDAEEELRLIRMKDCGAVYDTLLRSLTIPLALQSADTVLARLGGAS